MSTVGQVDPKIQALFDENLATTRSANAAVTAKLKAGQDRLAAEAKAREEKHQKDVAASLASAKDVARHGDQHRKPPQWQQRDRSAGEMAFGPEDDEAGYSPPPVSAPAPVQPPPPPPVAPVPMRPRRPARVDDDDDDLSGQTWLS
ncbi:hypothetical protein ABZ345_38535 [Lentzea sp. NPDC005914]|uniref:hypothetical protein n=1 Tax=Lentzea sp. NPDC005914 TaxID=3154572 RepID=UPI0033D9B7C7